MDLELSGSNFSMTFVDIMLPASYLDQCCQHGDWITDWIAVWIGHRWSADTSWIFKALDQSKEFRH